MGSVLGLLGPVSVNGARVTATDEKSKIEKSRNAKAPCLYSVLSSW